MDKENYWEDQLKDKGVRCTRQRLAILKLLNKEDYPLSAQDIYAKLKDNNPGLRLSTVYRNLNYFEKKKLVRRLNLNNKESMFELLDGEHHHHLICIKCGEIIPLNCPLKEYEKLLTQRTNYTIVEHKLKIFGICPECKESSGS